MSIQFSDYDLWKTTPPDDSWDDDDPEEDEDLQAEIDFDNGADECMERYEVEQ